MLDGFGDEVATHAKTLPFIYKGLVEALDPGTELTVLVTEDALVGTAICLFCERAGAQPNPFPMLDVDLMLVASLANRRSMEGHLATAHDMWLRWRAEALVVQQFDEPAPPALGYVLAPVDSLRSLSEDLLCTAAWNRRPKRNP